MVNKTATDPAIVQTPMASKERPVDEVTPESSVMTGSTSNNLTTGSSDSSLHPPELRVEDVTGGDARGGGSDHQPAVLDTIDPSKRGSRTNNTRLPRGNSKGSEEEDVSPRSIDNMKGHYVPERNSGGGGGGKHGQPPLTISTTTAPPPPPRAGKPSRAKHRRAASEGIPCSIPPHQYHANNSRQYYGHPPPGASAGPPMMPMPHSPQMNSGMMYPTYQQQPVVAAARDRTWSNDGHGIPEQSPATMMMLPPPSPGRPMIPHQAMASERPSRRTSSRRGRGHRKSHSSSAAMPGGGYGSFWGSDGGQAAAQMMAGGGGQASFSPRGDFMSLTSSLRGREELTPPVTPSQMHHKSCGPDFPTWSPASFTQSPYPTESAGPGGEAVFLLQKKHRPESSRKMHMRQQSAQLFMDDIKGVEQPPKCRDVVWLLLFVFHLVYIVFLGTVYDTEAVNPQVPEKDKVIVIEGEDASSTVTILYHHLIYIASLSGLFAVVVSGSLLVLMTLFPRKFVQMSLMVAITLSFIWGTIGIGLSPRNVVPITGVIALLLSVAYAFIVWDRIPFAAANLQTALSGVRDHLGTILISLVFQAFALGWSVYFAIVVCGVYDAIKNGDIKLSGNATIVVYILFGMSYYWTVQVLQNTVQVATARIIHQWWYMEDESVVQHTAFKTLFYRMGSVCFGSLVVGPVRVIRQFSVFFRPSSDEASLLCLHECLHCIQTCITSCVDKMNDHFNPWAFTYIGLFGYGFMDSGHRATETFEKRGWKTIVSDDLVPNILMMTGLVIGGVTGCFALLLAYHGLDIVVAEEPGAISFTVGLVIGLVLTSVLFAVISSSVNASIVCFATSPVDFERNHPELSHEMRNAWREVWPGALDGIDLRVAVAMAGSPAHANGVPVL